ncbi:MAG: Pr6Pr family membrane protein [Yoonia sp.]|uniref:Pr6Pr family membrane protein n=1 Tax=Yoonia sp. TaxID=2212373 RepID=UPI003EF2C063
MRLARLIAAVLAVFVAATLCLRFWLTMHNHDVSLLPAMWIDFRYFTIWANTLVGLVCGVVALGRVPPQWLTAGPAMAIALVASVYHALLAASRTLDGLDYVADFMVHTIVPVAFIVFWLVMLPKDRLQWRDLTIWAAFPIVYSVYAIARGAGDGIYPYFFLDVANIGVAGVAAWVAGLAAAFLLIGAGIIFIAHRIHRTA